MAIGYYDVIVLWSTVKSGKNIIVHSWGRYIIPFREYANRKDENSRDAENEIYNYFFFYQYEANITWRSIVRRTQAVVRYF